jgi:hypothetical protein
MSNFGPKDKEVAINSALMSRRGSDVKQGSLEPYESPPVTVFSKISVWLTLSFMAIAQVTDG